MNLSHLRIFSAVVEHQSFTAAAKACGLPTSSVSRAVGHLERDLGGRLFERTTRRTALTSLGRAVHEHAARALFELQEGERRVHELQRDPRGEVRVTAPPDLDDGFLAQQLARFAAEHPRIRVTVVLQNAYADLVTEGFDLALRVASALPDSGLGARPLGAYRAWLMASADYVARRGAPRTPHELTQHDCVLTVPRAGQSEWPLVGPEGELSVLVRGHVAADDLRFVRELVVAGAGIGVVAAAPQTSMPHDPRLVRVLPAYELKAPKLFLVVPSARRVPSRVALLRDFLVRSYG